MQRQQIHSYLFVLGLALTLSSCFNEPNYSNTPEIEFQGISPYTLPAGTGVGKPKRDSVVITISFKDGDGNLGDDSPSAADIARYKSNGGWGNYEIKTFRYINRKYVEFGTDSNRVNSFLLFPDLTKGKPKGAIEGTIDFNQLFPYGTRIVFYPTKFQIRIRDRALNVSNVIETDTIPLPFVN